MHDQRAVGEIERRLRQVELVQVDQLIGHRRVVRDRLCSLEHAHGRVERENVGRASSRRPAGEGTEARSEVDDVRPDQIGKEGPDR